MGNVIKSPIWPSQQRVADVIKAAQAQGNVIRSQRNMLVMLPRESANQEFPKVA